MPNKTLRLRGLPHPRLSPLGLYQLFRYCSNPRTRTREDVYLSSRGRTGNRKMPRDMLHQCLQMRFAVHRIHARIARPTRLQDRHTCTKWCWDLQGTAVKRVQAAAPELIEGLVRHFAAQRAEKMVLHRLRTPGTHWYHLFRRQANLHVVVIILRRRRRRSRFGSCNHRSRGGLVPSSSICRSGRRGGRFGGFASVMLSRTSCGLLPLLLPGGMAVALARNAFHRLALLALGAVPLLVTLLSTNETLVIIVPTAPPCINPSDLGSLACVLFVSSMPWSLVSAAGTVVESRRFAVCRRAASWASITAWSGRCSSMMLNNALEPSTTMLNLISLSTLRRSSGGSIFCLLYTSPSPRD